MTRCHDIRNPLDGAVLFVVALLFSEDFNFLAAFAWNKKKFEWKNGGALWLSAVLDAKSVSVNTPQMNDSNDMDSA